MAEIDLFHYRKGSGFLHSIDTRIKLLLFLFLTLITFQSNNISLIIISFTVLILFLLEYMQSGIISPLRFLKTISFFLIFLIFIILGRWVAIGGIAGLVSGAIYSWKLLIILINGQLLTSTTDPSGIQSAVYKTLKPVPFLPAGQIAIMVSLTITFIPLIFDQYLECRDANNSRLGNTTGNPMKKIFSIAYPLLLNTIFRAEEIAMAMESRCYNENPTMPEMKIKMLDIICLFVMLTYFTGIIFLNIVYSNY